jgi:putative membrane protein
VTSRVLSRTLFFALSGAAVALLHQHLPQVAFDPAPFASLGVVLGLLLVFRSSAGYNRWWEARVLWGSITNESRNLLVSARAYGPRDPAWQRAFAAWIAAFAPASRCSLRRQRTHPALEALLGPDAAAALASAPHMPSHVSEQLAALLHQARAHGLDGFAFDQLDHERARLIEHIGGCERILATPIPHVVEVMTRRFLTMYLLAAKRQSSRGPRAELGASPGVNPGATFQKARIRGPRAFHATATSPALAGLLTG